MTLQVLDRIKETSTTAGTGPWTLAGAVAVFQPFSKVGDGNTVYYAATSTTDWEVGLGTYALAANTLTRTSVLASSNAGAAVNFSGTVTIWGDYPASQAVMASNTVTLTNKSIDGGGNTLTNIGNSSLVNSSMTLAGHSVSLGGTQAFAASDLSNGVTGSGAIVLATSPTLVTPALGTPASGTLTNCTGLPNAGLVNSSMTLAGHSVSLGGTQAFAAADLSNGVTGSGSIVLATSPTLVTPALGTPASGTLTNCTGLPSAGVITGTSGALIPLLNGANTWSGVQSFNSGDVALKGATSGTITLNAAAVAGSNTITLPAGTTDFSSTGGTSQVVKQTSAGGAFTVAQLAASDITGLAAGANPTGTVGLSAVNGSATSFLRSDGAPPLSQAIAPTWTGLHTFDAGLAFGAQTVAFGTTGGAIQGAWTRTDSTTGAGTVATNYGHKFAIITDKTAANAITITNDYGVWFEPPAAGTNVTITNAWAAGFNGAISIANGTAAAPTLTFANSAAVGFYSNNANSVVFVQGSNNQFQFSANVFRGHASGAIGFSATANDATTGIDTAFTRDAAGVIDVGNGVASDKSGSINLTNLTASKKVRMSTSTALGNTGTLTLDPTLSELFTSTPSGAMTVNAGSAAIGTKVVLEVTTSGTTSFNITFNTSFKSQGVLATGTVSGKVFTVTFIGDGTNLVEQCRTAAM